MKNQLEVGLEEKRVVRRTEYRGEPIETLLRLSLSNSSKHKARVAKLTGMKPQLTLDCMIPVSGFATTAHVESLLQ